MYHEGVHALAQHVLKYARKHGLLQAGDSVGLAVSGGADSVALLRLLMELRGEIGIVLSVAHFNHKLRGTNSDGDERFVAELAAKHSLQFHCEGGDVRALAVANQLSLEAVARDMRYGYFRRLLNQNIVDHIATAHTLDDQAETVLLKVVRGAGSRGLVGIYPKLAIAQNSTQHSALSIPPKTGGHGSSIIRPLLAARRQEIEAYLKEIDQEWREDPSNRDLRHARNRVRHGILPRLERYLNPAVREALADAAEIARAEEVFWLATISELLPKFWKPPGALGTGGVLTRSLPSDLALRRRIVLASAESVGLTLEFKHVEEILDLAAFHAPTGGAVTLPRGWIVRREKDVLHFVPPSDKPAAVSYEHSLAVPGSVDVPEIESHFEAAIVSGDVRLVEQALDVDLVAGRLTVRNWRAGDRFWPAHTKAPKKVKELLSEKHVTGLEKQSWPVVVSGDQLIWVRGFRAPRSVQPPNGAQRVVIIRESPTGRLE